MTKTTQELISKTDKLSDLKPTVADYLHIPYSYALAQDSLINAVAMHNKSGFEIGLWLIAIKEYEEHGNYTAAVERCGMTARNALRYMKRTTYILTHEDEFGHITLRNLNGSKIDTLLKLPNQTTAELYDDDGKLGGLSEDEIAQLTAPQFAATMARFTGVIDAAEDEIAHLTEQNGKAAMQQTKLLDRIDQLEADKKRLTCQPELVEQCQIMGSHWTDSALDSLGRLQGLIERCRNHQPDVTDTTPETTLELSASALAYNLRFIQAKANELLADLLHDCKDSVRDNIGEQVHMDEAYLKRVENMRNDMLMRHDTDEAILTNAVADKLGKRGRRLKVS